MPGTFDPPTIAHVAIAEAALALPAVDRLVVTLSRIGADKPSRDMPAFEQRLAVVRQSLSHLRRADVEATSRRLLVDICRDFSADLLVIGADKWHQIREPRFYGDDLSRRDEAVAALPHQIVAPRDGIAVPVGVERLHVPDWVGGVSSTRARSGHSSEMTAPARALDESTGCWSEQA